MKLIQDFNRVDIDQPINRINSDRLALLVLVANHDGVRDLSKDLECVTRTELSA